MITTNQIDPNLLFVSQKVDTAVTTISQKMGVATDHFYPILVKQQMFEGLYWVTCLGVLLLVCFICAILSFCFHRKFVKTSNGNRKDENLKTFYGNCSFFFGTVSCVATLIFLINLFNSTTQFGKINNPEYYALKDIITMIK